VLFRTQLVATATSWVCLEKLCRRGSPSWRHSSGRAGSAAWERPSGSARVLIGWWKAWEGDRESADGALLIENVQEKLTKIRGREKRTCAEGGNIYIYIVGTVVQMWHGAPMHLLGYNKDARCSSFIVMWSSHYNGTSCGVRRATRRAARRQGDCSGRSAVAQNSLLFGFLWLYFQR
jgi:hypothetical protein